MFLRASPKHMGTAPCCLAFALKYISKGEKKKTTSKWGKNPNVEYG
jgi:hypothetical protein